jgi:hypothetical protein
VFHPRHRGFDDRRFNNWHHSDTRYIRMSIFVFILYFEFEISQKCWPGQKKSITCRIHSTNLTSLLHMYVYVHTYVHMSSPAVPHCERPPYPITEVKQHWARSVLWWVGAILKEHIGALLESYYWNTIQSAAMIPLDKTPKTLNIHWNPHLRFFY